MLYGLSPGLLEGVFQFVTLADGTDLFPAWVII
jgi:hypothetical protein